MKRRSTDSTTTLAHVTPIHYSIASSPKIIASEPPHRRPNKKRNLPMDLPHPKYLFKGKWWKKTPQKIIIRTNVKLPIFPQPPPHPVSTLNKRNMRFKKMKKGSQQIQLPIIKISMKHNIPTPPPPQPPSPIKTPLNPSNCWSALTELGKPLWTNRPEISNMGSVVLFGN